MLIICIFSATVDMKASKIGFALKGGNINSLKYFFNPTSEKSGMDHVIWLHIPDGMLPTPIVLCCLDFFE